MTYETLSALIGFAIVTSISPGPNNIMLMASGANFGFRRTVPHMIGVSLGFGIMMLAVGVGLSKVFDTWPVTLTTLKVISAVYLLYLAWKITRASAPGRGEAGGTPLSFIQAAGFQWVNPKAWAMALGAISLFANGGGLWSVLPVAAVFMLINLPNVAAWALVGTKIQSFLSSPAKLQVFNWTMAILLVASVLPMVVR